MNIDLIKILRYDLKPEGVDTYTYLTELTSQKIDPTTLEREKLIVAQSLILASPLRRSLDCINTSGKDIITLNLLKEIPFNLTEMCSREEWLIEHSRIVRRNFKHAFVNDTLLFSRRLIIDQIKDIITLCKNHVGIAVVSHSFRIKLIEAFVKSGGKIEDEPSIIHEFIFDDKKTLDFGETIQLKI